MYDDTAEFALNPAKINCKYFVNYTFNLFTNKYKCDIIML